MSSANELMIKDLFGRLKTIQQTMYESFLLAPSRKFVIHCSRRIGKTYLLCILAITFALSKSNAQIRYASVTQKAVRKMIHPIFKSIFATYKPELRPKWNGQEGAYIFKNGSMIHVAGVNGGHEDDLRGTDADLAIVDEAAFVDNLTYLTESVLMPQLINTGGKLIMASSSPLSPAHEFSSYIQEAKLEGFYAAYDIHESGYSKDLIAEFCKEAGGQHSDTWRREYLNELIIDSSLAIIPEFNDSYVQDTPRTDTFKFYHKYEAMDLGVRDFTAVLFGYYDFKRAALIVEDEFVINGPDMTTDKLALEIQAKELNLQYPELYRRISDNNNLLLLQDLGSLHNLHFQATNKDTLAAMVNEVRMWVKSGRVIINPKCKQLIGCLKYGLWNKNRDDFARTKVYGHFDALASLIYLIRNIDQSSNPIPIHYGYSAGNTHIDQQETDKVSTFNKILNVK